MEEAQQNLKNPPHEFRDASRSAVLKRGCSLHPPPPLLSPSDTFALSMVNSVDCLSPSRRRFVRDDDDDFTLRFRTDERRRGNRVCDARPFVSVVGTSPTVFAPSGRREKPGKPHARRMHRSRNWRGREGGEGGGRGGSLNRRRQDQASPCPSPHTLPYVRHNARRLAPRRCTLSHWKGVCTDHTRGAVPSLSLSLSLSSLSLPATLLLPPVRPSVSLSHPFPSSLSLSLSLFIPPTRCVCLFIVAFWEIPDTRVTEPHTRAAPRAAACIPILELHPVGSRIPPRLRKTAGWRYIRTGSEL